MLRIERGKKLSSIGTWSWDPKTHEKNRQSPRGSVESHGQTYTQGAGAAKVPRKDGLRRVGGE